MNWMLESWEAGRLGGWEAGKLGGWKAGKLGGWMQKGARLTAYGARCLVNGRRYKDEGGGYKV
jgi:hypothetical protein